MSGILRFLLSIWIFAATGCGAPLSIGSVVDWKTVADTRRIVKSRMMLRRGRYCSHIVVRPPASEALDKKDWPRKEDISARSIKAKYVIRIPDTGFYMEGDLGAFDEAPFTWTSDGYFLYQIEIPVKDIHGYRAEVLSEIYFDGAKKELDGLEFRFDVTSWICL